MRSPNEFNWEKEWMEVEKGAELKKTKLANGGKVGNKISTQTKDVNHVMIIILFIIQFYNLSRKNVTVLEVDILEIELEGGKN